jgi:hypothetical protein
MGMPSFNPSGVPDLSSDHFSEKGSSLARATGFLLLGLFFFLLAWLAATRLGEVVGGGIVGFVVATVAGIAMGFVGARFVVRAKRYHAKSAQKVMAHDPRPPVLYFRPFAADSTAGKAVTFTSWFTEEEELAMVMNEIGPFIGIGAPNEALPEVGAARFYAPDSEWQNAVQYLLGRARLVVLRIGRTDGFWWELKNTLTHRKPEELLLLIPRDEQLYEDFRRNSRDLLPCDLPRLTGWNYHKLWRGSLMAAIFFDPDWVPNIVELQTYSLSFFRRSPAYPLVPVMKMALGPLFQHLGLPWKRPGISWRLIMTLAGIALLAGVMALRLDDSRVSFATTTVATEPHPAEPQPEEQAVAPSPQQQRLAAVLAAEGRMGERMAAIPGLQAQLEQMIQSNEFRALSREQASARVQAFSRKHSHAGLRRLDDAGLLSKLELDQKIINAADPNGCAAFARSQIPADQLHVLLSHLEEADVERWYDLIVQATAADIAGTPAPRSANSEWIQQSLASMIAGLPAGDAQKLRRILADYGHASEDEVCWSERTLRQGISALGKDDQVAWALSIVQ